MREELEFRLVVVGTSRSIHHVERDPAIQVVQAGAAAGVNVVLDRAVAFIAAIEKARVEGVTHLGHKVHRHVAQVLPVNILEERVLFDLGRIDAQLGVRREQLANEILRFERHVLWNVWPVDICQKKKK